MAIMKMKEPTSGVQNNKKINSLTIFTSDIAQVATNE